MKYWRFGSESRSRSFGRHNFELFGIDKVIKHDKFWQIYIIVVFCNSLHCSSARSLFASFVKCHNNWQVARSWRNLNWSSKLSGAQWSCDLTESHVVYVLWVISQLLWFHPGRGSNPLEGSTARCLPLDPAESVAWSFIIFLCFIFTFNHKSTFLVMSHVCGCWSPFLMFMNPYVLVVQCLRACDQHCQNIKLPWISLTWHLMNDLGLLDNL